MCQSAYLLLSSSLTFIPQFEELSAEKGPNFITTIIIIIIASFLCSIPVHISVLHDFILNKMSHGLPPTTIFHPFAILAEPLLSSFLDELKFYKFASFFVFLIFWLASSPVLLSLQSQNFMCFSLRTSYLFALAL